MIKTNEKNTGNITAVCKDIKGFLGGVYTFPLYKGIPARGEKKSDFSPIIQALYENIKISKVNFGGIHSSPGKQDGIEHFYKEEEINAALQFAHNPTLAQNISTCFSLCKSLPKEIEGLIKEARRLTGNLTFLKTTKELIGVFASYYQENWKIKSLTEYCAAIFSALFHSEDKRPSTMATSLELIDAFSEMFGVEYLSQYFNINHAVISGLRNYVKLNVCAEPIVLSPQLLSAINKDINFLFQQIPADNPNLQLILSKEFSSQIEIINTLLAQKQLKSLKLTFKSEGKETTLWDTISTIIDTLKIPPSHKTKIIIAEQGSYRNLIMKLGQLSQEEATKYLDVFTFEIDPTTKKTIFTKIIPELVLNVGGFDAQQAATAFLISYKHMGDASTNIWSKDDSLAIANSMLKIVCKSMSEGKKISSELILRLQFTINQIITSPSKRLDTIASKSTMEENYLLLETVSKLHQLSEEIMFRCELEAKMLQICKDILSSKSKATFLKGFFTPRSIANTSSLFELREALKKGENPRLLDILSPMQLSQEMPTTIKSCIVPSVKIQDYTIFDDYSSTDANPAPAPASTPQLYPDILTKKGGKEDEGDSTVFFPPSSTPPDDAVPMPQLYPYLSSPPPSAPPLPDDTPEGQGSSTAPPSYESSYSTP